MTLWLIPAVLAAPIVVVLLVAAVRPAGFRVERRTSIAATPERIFGFLEDFHRWPAWSPWEKLDPAMTRTHSGAPSGVGAVYEWRGNKKVGRGRMEILEATAPSRLLVQLDFLEPWAARNRTEFTLAPAAGDTEVTWSLSGTSPFMMRVMGVFVSMDRLVGRDFARGLANLKAAAES